MFKSKEELLAIQPPEQYWQLLQSLTLHLRGTTRRPEDSAGPSRYMPYFTAMAKGMYAIAEVLSEDDGGWGKKMPINFWMERMYNMSLQKSVPRTLMHHAAFQQDIESAWSQHSVYIGELAYLGRQGRFSRWWNRKRIKELQWLAIKFRRKLDLLNEEYNLPKLIAGKDIVWDTVNIVSVVEGYPWKKTNG